MAYIDNTETAKELDDAIRGNANSNQAPKQIANQVIPVIDINPKHSRRCNILRSVTSGTIYTTPSDKDFYLVAATLASDLNGASASGTPTITLFPKGETTAITLLSLRLRTSALVDVDSDSIAISLTNPILLERNTAIVVNTSGSTTRHANIIGYTVEP